MRRSVKFKTPSCNSDFARSCPDRESMNCFGLMSELMSAVDILSARQNQWVSSNDAKSTIQVLEAAQSSTLLFVRKSVDETNVKTTLSSVAHFKTKLCPLWLRTMFLLLSSPYVCNFYARASPAIWHLLTDSSGLKMKRSLMCVNSYERGITPGLSTSSTTVTLVTVWRLQQGQTLQPDDEAGKPRDLRYFDEDSACSMFFRHSTCYDVLPESGKLLVLDSTLPIRRAMQALIDHSLSAAPVWCSRLQCYTQLLTTDLCLRLLAQAFPLDTAPSSSPSANGNGEDESARKKNSDPSVSMNYWEGKTMGSVLKTFFNWAHAECPQEAVPELVTMVTPQDHLYRVTRILTLATPTSASTETTIAKTSVLNTVPPPRYVLIADRYGSGNLLGLLNSDRLLAYLRVRMRNLPTPSSLNSNVGDLPGIRWEERGWQTADSTDLNDGEGETLSSEVRRSARRRILSSSGNSFYLQPTTTCREALHIITRAWNEAGLSCLPVATENGTGFQGMLTKHDILGTIFAGPLDVALNATIGTVLSVRPRAACLVVFDKPGSGASWNGQGALGQAIGVITATDLLQAIVIDAPTPPLSASYADIPEDAFVSKATPLVKGRYLTRSGGSVSKRYSLPVEMANSLSGGQIVSPFSNHQSGGITKIFHRAKRYSESEVSPLEGPFAATVSNNVGNNSGQSHRPNSHQPGKTTPTPSHQHNMDDGTLFEMDECINWYETFAFICPPVVSMHTCQARGREIDAPQYTLFDVDGWSNFVNKVDRRMGVFHKSDFWVPSLQTSRVLITFLFWPASILRIAIVNHPAAFEEARIEPDVNIEDDIMKYGSLST
ncbi:hypothetical protein ACTXT7_010405 [Hymenolepis weldensis]